MGGAADRPYACSCRYEPDDPELARIADAIFAGNRGRRPPLWRDSRTYSFAVDRVYKGQVHATQQVTTHVQGPACGLELNGSGPFLVHAYQDPEGAETLRANSAAAPARVVRPPTWARGIHPLAGA